MQRIGCFPVSKPHARCKWNTTWAGTCSGDPKTYTCPATTGTTSKVLIAEGPSARMASGRDRIGMSYSPTCQIGASHYLHVGLLPAATSTMGQGEPAWIEYDGCAHPLLPSKNVHVSTTRWWVLSLLVCERRGYPVCHDPDRCPEMLPHDWLCQEIRGQATRGRKGYRHCVPCR